MTRVLSIVFVFCAVFALCDIAAAQDEIGYGDTVTGTIDNANPEYVYYFTAGAGDVVTIAHTAQDGDLDPLLILMDEAGNFITQDDDSGEGRSSLIRDFEISTAGTYRIIATRYDRADGDTAGEFELALISGDPGAMPASSGADDQAPVEEGETSPTPVDEFGELPVLEGTTYTMLAYGETGSGTISDAVQAEAFVFGGHAGDTVTIRVMRTSGDLMPDIGLFDPTGRNILAAAEDTEGTGAVTLSHTLPEIAYYVVGVRRVGYADGTTAGDYTIVVDLPPAVDIVLTWDTRADLDLVLYYPSEEQAASIDWQNVFYNEPLPEGVSFVTETEEFCPQADQPSERITWRAGDAPSGGYEILVIYWFPCAEGSVEPVNFELTYTVDGVTETVTGTLNEPLDEFRVAFVR